MESIADGMVEGSEGGVGVGDGRMEGVGGGVKEVGGGGEGGEDSE